MTPRTNWFAFAALGLERHRWNLESIERLACESESWLRSEQRRVEESWTAHKERLTESEAEELLDGYVEDYHEVSAVFPSMLRQAILVSAIAEIEFMLFDVCRNVERDLQLRLSVADLDGKGIVRSRKYLTRVAGVDLSGAAVEWEHLVLAGAVRNMLIHNGGKVGSNDKVTPQLSKIPGVIIDDQRKIQLGAETVLHIVSQAQSLRRKLAEVVTARIRGT
jgi:hypothetical protein